MAPLPLSASPAIPSLTESSSQAPNVYVPRVSSRMALSFAPNAKQAARLAVALMAPGVLAASLGEFQTALGIAYAKEILSPMPTDSACVPPPILLQTASALSSRASAVPTKWKCFRGKRPQTMGMQVGEETAMGTYKTTAKKHPQRILLHPANAAQDSSESKESARLAA